MISNAIACGVRPASVADRERLLGEAGAREVTR